MSRLRRLALGLSVLALLAGLATAAYAAGRQHSPGPSTPTDTTTTTTTTTTAPPTTQPEPRLSVSRRRQPRGRPPPDRSSWSSGGIAPRCTPLGGPLRRHAPITRTTGSRRTWTPMATGIPCETVYGEVGGQGPAPVPQEDCDPAYPDDCLSSPPPDLDCADVGHRVTVDHSYGDPHRLDADRDGIGCDRFG
jgi:hypothetical protein